MSWSESVWAVSVLGLSVLLAQSQVIWQWLNVTRQVMSPGEALFICVFVFEEIWNVGPLLLSDTSSIMPCWQDQQCTHQKLSRKRKHLHTTGWRNAIVLDAKRLFENLRASVYISVFYAELTFDNIWTLQKLIVVYQTEKTKKPICWSRSTGWMLLPVIAFLKSFSLLHGCQTEPWQPHS